MWEVCLDRASDNEINTICDQFHKKWYLELNGMEQNPTSAVLRKVRHDWEGYTANTMVCCHGAKTHWGEDLSLHGPQQAEPSGDGRSTQLSRSRAVLWRWHSYDDFVAHMVVLCAKYQPTFQRMQEINQTTEDNLSIQTVLGFIVHISGEAKWLSHQMICLVIPAEMSKIVFEITNDRNQSKFQCRKS